MLILLERPDANSLGFACQHQNYLIGYHAGQLGDCASDLGNRTVGRTDLLTRMLPKGSMQTSSLRAHEA